MSRKLIIDGDYVLFVCSAAAQKTTILVSNETESHTFLNRTEFKAWCKAESKDHSTFKIEDKVTAEPLKKALDHIDFMIGSFLKATGLKEYEIYLGSKPSFRIEASTMLEYKGNRKDITKPYWFSKCREYLVETHKAKILESSLETDDYVVMLTVGNKDVVASQDKDFYGCPIYFYNPLYPNEGIVDCRGFGELRRDGKKIRGKGRLFLYWQMLAGDTSDNYKLSCLSKGKFGEVGAFNALVDCKSDVEAWEAMIKVAKELYPEPFILKSWNGKEYQADWLYCLNEQFQMAKMKEKEDFNPTAEKIIRKLGLEAHL